MGRNRGKTTCECGFWDFAWPGRPTCEVQAGVPGLLPWGALRPGVHREPQGYGFGEHLFGRVSFGWSSPDGRNSSSSERPGWIERWVEYLPVPLADRYRYSRIECPVCMRAYIGWYRAIPPSIGVIERSLAYELYDLSFWHSGTDDPSDADLEGVVAWTPDLVVEALGCFREANPGAFGGGRD